MGNQQCKRCSHIHHEKSDTCNFVFLNDQAPQNCPCVAEHGFHKHGTNCTAKVIKSIPIKTPKEVEYDSPIHQKTRKQVPVKKTQQIIKYEDKSVQKKYTDYEEKTKYMTEEYFDNYTKTKRSRQVPMKVIEPVQRTKTVVESVPVNATISYEELEWKDVDEIIGYEKKKRIEQVVIGYDKFETICGCEYSCRGTCCVKEWKCTCRKL